MKPILEIPDRFGRLADWNRFLTESLVRSDMFQISYGDFPPVPNTFRCRKNLSFLRLHGKLIALDTWDREPPSSLGYDVFNAVDLLLKIEFRPHQLWRQIEQRHDLVIRPWTMFGYHEFPAAAFRWQPDGHWYVYSFSGSQKLSKSKWLRYFVERGMPVYDVQPPEEYMPMLERTRWGVILQGSKGRCP